MESLRKLWKRQRLDVALTLAGAAIVLLVVFMALAAPLLAPYSPVVSVDDALLPPSARHPMGTDSLGRDVYSRVLYGAQIILIVVLTSTTVSLVLGSTLGLISGYFGGSVDRVLSVIMDSVYAFPGLILAIAVAAMLGPGILNTVISISVVYIPTYFRMVRGHVLSVKGRLFVEAAKALGASDWTIMVKYVLPNVLVTIPVVFSMNVADAVLTEAALSFLGLGVPAPTPDWGFDLKNGQRNLLSGYWWPALWPGFFITLLALGFSLVGEGLNELVGGER